MFTLFHFGSELFKIAILAAAYSSIIRLLLSLFIKISRSEPIRPIKLETLYFSTAGLLFIFSFTYYGNHGLGDEANLPLGHFKTMNSGDGYAYFNIGSKQISVDSFLVYNDHLCFASTDGYYDYQLHTDKYSQFNSRQKYEAYAFGHKLPGVNNFKPFFSQYTDYWNGWRFWLLP